MLTKKQIEAIEIGGRDDEWEMSGDLSMDDARELRRLALLGLEREESRARVEAAAEADTHVELSVLDDSFGAFPDLGLGPDLDLGPEPHEAFLTEERDRERAERVGRAVLRELSDQGVELPGLRDGYASEGGIIAVIAAAMEEP